ncbi:hypothetical protein H6768_04040 [Candidatus Peribacteria bacterium]|nr:hypothetical protein [Candidatus Peribacteria bacterium]
MHRVTVSVGALMVRIGATVQFTAPVRINESIEPLVLIVVTAVGSVVQVPPDTWTIGGVVYPPPP